TRKLPPSSDPWLISCQLNGRTLIECGLIDGLRMLCLPSMRTWRPWLNEKSLKISKESEPSWQERSRSFLRLEPSALMRSFRLRFRQRSEAGQLFLVSPNHSWSICTSASVYGHSLTSISSFNLICFEPCRVSPDQKSIC